MKRQDVTAQVCGTCAKIYQEHVWYRLDLGLLEGSVQSRCSAQVAFSVLMVPTITIIVIAKELRNADLYDFLLIITSNVSIGSDRTM